MKLNVDQVLLKAVQAHKAGRLQAAKQLYLAILKDHPGHPDANHNFGVLHSSLGQHQRALQFLKKALDGDRSQGQYWVSYINALILCNKFSEALSVLRDGMHVGLSGSAVTQLAERLADKIGPIKHLLQSPSEQDINNVLASFGSGDYLLAEQQARTLTNIYPNHAFGWKALGTVIRATGRVEESLEFLRQALQINPLDSEICSNLGNALLDLGRVKEAEEYYREAIRLKPDFAEAQHNLGTSLVALRSLQEAEVCYREAIRTRPTFAEAYSNLGNVLKELHKRSEAEASYREAIRLNPKLSAAHNSLGSFLRENGKLHEAEASYREAVRLSPGDAGAHCNLGNVLDDLGRPIEAEACYRESLRIRPDYSEVLSNLGATLNKLGRSSEAEISYREAIRLRPGFAIAHSNLGKLLMERGQIVEAEASYREAIRIEPNFAEAYSNLVDVLCESGRLAEAEMACREAIRLKPELAEAHYNLGLVLANLGRISEAENSYRQSIHFKPNYVTAYWNLSLALLLMGKFDEGLQLYELRWDGAKEAFGQRREFPQPLWSGREALAGKTILIHAEQGLGDTIQFCRYLANVKELGATVIFEVQPSLVSLLSGLSGVDMLIPKGQPLPNFDLHCSLLSLPLAFKTQLMTIPAYNTYIVAQPERIARWASTLGREGFRVGICWRGAGHIKGRAIPIEYFGQLSSIPGIRLISLHKGEGEGDLGNLPGHMRVETLGSSLDVDGAFMDTAAVIKCCDLIITNDTSIAHLAGALGAPTWTVLKAVPDWRWMMDRSDSPWYPTMRLFRQTKIGDWEGVFTQIRAALEAAVGTAV